MSQDSSDSREREPVFIQASDIRRRLTDSLNAPTKSFQRDPEDPSAAALKVTTIIYNYSAFYWENCNLILYLISGTVGGESGTNSRIISLWSS